MVCYLHLIFSVEFKHTVRDYPTIRKKDDILDNISFWIHWLVSIVVYQWLIFRFFIKSYFFLCVDVFFLNCDRMTLAVVNDFSFPRNTIATSFFSRNWTYCNSRSMPSYIVSSICHKYLDFLLLSFHKAIIKLRNLKQIQIRMIFTLLPYTPLTTDKSHFGSIKNCPVSGYTLIYHTLICK